MQRNPHSKSSPAAFRTVIREFSNDLALLDLEIKDAEENLEALRAKREKLADVVDAIEDKAAETTGRYTGKTLAESIEDALKQSGAPMSPQEIADALLDGGFQTKSQNFRNTCISVLNQQKHPEGPFAKVGDDWGLMRGQSLSADSETETAEQEDSN